MKYFINNGNKCDKYHQLFFVNNCCCNGTHSKKHIRKELVCIMEMVSTKIKSSIKVTASDSVQQHARDWLDVTSDKSNENIYKQNLSKQKEKNKKN